MAFVDGEIPRNPEKNHWGNGRTNKKLNPDTRGR